MNTLWASLIAEECSRLDIGVVCLSPGSRSTPLTLAMARHRFLKKKVLLDERAAAFYALGAAKASGKTSVLVATSGTAVANYFPAIVEASKDSIPLLVLTADRPPELRETYENQTIDQVKLFSSMVRWYGELPCPDAIISPRMVLSTIDYAVHRAEQGIKGPVHLNCPFRKPLEGSFDQWPLWEKDSSLLRWREGKEPFTRYCIPEKVLAKEQIRFLLELFQKEDLCAALLIGRLNGDNHALRELIKRVPWPCFADITSGCRADSISYYPLMLEQAPYHPEYIVHLGGTFVSNQLPAMIEGAPLKEYIHIEDTVFRKDSKHRITQKIEFNPEQFAQQIIPYLPEQEAGRYKCDFQRKSALINAYVESNLSSVIEAAAAKKASAKACFVGNSMPIRDVDIFSCSSALLVSNRGASGIDGNIASAVAYAESIGEPLRIFIGDLTALHDLNSLLIVAKSSVPITLIIVNNQGGGIFSFLPVHEEKDVFEDYFAVSHDIDFKAFAAGTSLDYQRVETLENFESALNTSGSSMIELVTNRQENLQQHRDFKRSVFSILEESACVYA